MVYHEGRNVRHQKSNVSEVEWLRYQTLLSLPKNKFEAWRQMGSVRATAATNSSPSIAFERKYGLTVAELAELFDRPIWKHSQCGGNKWADIARKIAKILEVHVAGDTLTRDQLINEVLAMSHNTGRVAAKLTLLRSS